MTPTTAFDADVLIYAAATGHPLGERVLPLFDGTPEEADGESDVGPAGRSRSAGTGSLLLLAEVLAKPMRDDPDSRETRALAGLISRLDLRPLDEPTARLALVLAVSYGLRAADATHLATAVASGADRFLTNNRRDFPQEITEIDVVYPEQLPAP